MNFEQFTKECRATYNNEIALAKRNHKLSDAMIDILKCFRSYPDSVVGRKSWMWDTTLLALTRRGLLVFCRPSGGIPTYKITSNMRLTAAGRDAVADLHFDGYAEYYQRKVDNLPRVKELKERLAGLFAEFAGTEFQMDNENLLPAGLVQQTMMHVPAKWDEQTKYELLDRVHHLSNKAG